MFTLSLYFSLIKIDVDPLSRGTCIMQAHNLACCSPWGHKELDKT